MSEVLGKGRTVNSSVDEAVKRAKRRDRYQTAERLRRFNGWLFGGKRLGQCGWRRGVNPGLKRGENGRVHWSGVKTCGSVWACLLCAAKIRAARAAEVDHLIKAHLASGGHCTFLTFTLRHYATDDLLALWVAMTKAWESMTSGQGYQDLKARYGILGFIKAVEVTIGFNGWHPHLHVVIFHDTLLSEDDGSLEEFRARFGQRWARYIAHQLNREIHYRYGVDAVIIRDDKGIGTYVSKIHLELVRSDLKQTRGSEGRTPWQVGVDAAESGDARDT
ncbi:MAG: protein rep, partial [bacterium]|nr:protein rep [bacterium]